MGVFLALVLDDDTRERIERISERLQLWNLAGRWQRAEDLHLTISYFGQVPEAEIGSLVYALDDVCRSLVSPQLSLVGLGAHGGREAPARVYAAVADPTDACMGLVGDVADALGERPPTGYHPHVTLCRPIQRRQHGPRGWPELLEANGLAEWGLCATTGLALQRRVTEPGPGPRFETIQRW